MKLLAGIVLALAVATSAASQELFEYQPLKPRWISPENPTGAAGRAAGEQGREGPSLRTLKAGATLVLGEINGAGDDSPHLDHVNERSPEMLRCAAPRDVLGRRIDARGLVAARRLLRRGRSARSSHSRTPSSRVPRAGRSSRRPDAVPSIGAHRADERVREGPRPRLLRRRLHARRSAGERRSTSTRTGIVSVHGARPGLPDSAARLGPRPISRRRRLASSRSGLREDVVGRRRDSKVNPRRRCRAGDAGRHGHRGRDGIRLGAGRLRHRYQGALVADEGGGAGRSTGCTCRSHFFEAGARSRCSRSAEREESRAAISKPASR